MQVLREGLAAINSGEIERILAFVHPDFVAIVPEELAQMRAEADFEWEVPERTASPENEPSPARQGSFAFE